MEYCLPIAPAGVLPLLPDSNRQSRTRPPLISLILSLWIFPTLWLGCFIIIAYGMLQTAMGQSQLNGASGARAQNQQTNPLKAHHFGHVEAECPICQERVGSRTPEGNRESWSMLPCGHHFGSHCIKRYLNISADEEPLCPVCRSKAYHEACGHPVLPFMLKSDGTHPDLIVDDVSGKVCPRKGRGFLEKACEYCQDPEGRSRRLAEAEVRPRWKRQVRWLWERLPFTKKPVASAASAASSASAASTASAATDRNRHERIRNQRNGGRWGRWEGPWMDVRSRDLGWEKWWMEQAPRGM